MSESKTEYEFKPKPSAIISMPVEERDKLVADARREALEDAAKAICEHCSKNTKVIKTKSATWEDPTKEVGYFAHQFSKSRLDIIYCQASPIHKLIERG